MCRSARGPAFSAAVSLACCNSVCLSLTLLCLSFCLSLSARSSLLPESQPLGLCTPMHLSTLPCPSVLTPSPFPVPSLYFKRAQARKQHRGLSRLSSASYQACRPGGPRVGSPRVACGQGRAEPIGAGLALGPPHKAGGEGRAALWRSRGGALWSDSPRRLSRSPAETCPGAPGPRRAGRCCCGCWRCCGRRGWARRAAAPPRIPSSTSATRRSVSPGELSRAPAVGGGVWGRGGAAQQTWSLGGKGWSSNPAPVASCCGRWVGPGRCHSNPASAETR